MVTFKTRVLSLTKMRTEKVYGETAAGNGYNFGELIWTLLMYAVKCKAKMHI